jgi:hypothetical protein
MHFGAHFVMSETLKATVRENNEVKVGKFRRAQLLRAQMIDVSKYFVVNREQSQQWATPQ